MEVSAESYSYEYSEGVERPQSADIGTDSASYPMSEATKEAKTKDYEEESYYYENEDTLYSETQSESKNNQPQEKISENKEKSKFSEISKEKENDASETSNDYSTYSKSSQPQKYSEENKNSLNSQISENLQKSEPTGKSESSYYTENEKAKEEEYSSYSKSSSKKEEAENKEQTNEKETKQESEEEEEEKEPKQESKMINEIIVNAPNPATIATVTYFDESDSEEVEEISEDLMKPVFSRKITFSRNLSAEQIKCYQSALNTYMTTRKPQPIYSSTPPPRVEKKEAAKEEKPMIYRFSQDPFRSDPDERKEFDYPKENVIKRSIYLSPRTNKDKNPDTLFTTITTVDTFDDFEDDNVKQSIKKPFDDDSEEDRLNLRPNKYLDETKTETTTTLDSEIFKHKKVKPEARTVKKPVAEKYNSPLKMKVSPFFVTDTLTTLNTFEPQRNLRKSARKYIDQESKPSQNGSLVAKNGFESAESISIENNQSTITNETSTITIKTKDINETSTITIKTKDINEQSTKSSHRHKHHHESSKHSRKSSSTKPENTTKDESLLSLRSMKPPKQLEGERFETPKESSTISLHTKEENSSEQKLSAATLDVNKLKIYFNETEDKESTIETGAVYSLREMSKKKKRSRISKKPKHLT